MNPNRLILLGSAVVLIVLAVIVAQVVLENDEPDQSQTENRPTKISKSKTKSPFNQPDPNLGQSRSHPEEKAQSRGKSAKKRLTKKSRTKLWNAIKSARTQRHQSQRTASSTSRSTAGHEDPSKTEEPEKLDREYIRGAFKEIVPLIRECYELALEEHDSLDGTLRVHLTIAAEPEVGGIVEDTDVEGDEEVESSDTLRECLVETVKTLEFPPPEEGGTVEVTYPLKFSSKAND